MAIDLKQTAIDPDIAVPPVDAETLFKSAGEAFHGVLISADGYCDRIDPAFLPDDPSFRLGAK